MTTSFSYTMPALADKLRTKGNGFYPSSSLRGLDLLTGDTGADSVHHMFSKGAIATSNQRVAEAFKSTQRFLYPQFQPKKSGNTASQPFASSSNQAGKMGYSGGSFNSATQGQRMSADDFDEYRKTILNRRINGFQAIREGILPPSMPITPFQALSGGRAQIDLLFTSIEERVYDDIFNQEIYRDLNNLMGLFINSIWEINDATTLSGYIERLQGMSREIDEQTERQQEEEGNLDTKDIRYSRSIEQLSSRLALYIANNIRGVGANDIIRKRLASDLSMLKINKTQQENLLRIGNVLQPPAFGGLPPRDYSGSDSTSSGGPSQGGPFIEEYGNDDQPPELEDGQSDAPSTAPSSAPSSGRNDRSQRFGPLSLNTFKQWMREAPVTPFDTAMAHRRILEQLNDDQLRQLAIAAFGYTGNQSGQRLRTYIYNKFQGMGRSGGNLALDIFSLGGLPLARAILGKGRSGGVVPPHMRSGVYHGNMNPATRVLFNSRSLL